jgi:hypothetical protein
MKVKLISLVSPRDWEIPTAAFHFQYSELAVGYPVFQKRLWLVLRSFPLSDCAIGNRRMRLTVLYWCIRFNSGDIPVFYCM